MATASKSKVMSIEEIERVYPDRWVLMEVTWESPRTHKVRGRVLFDSPDRDAISEYLRPYSAAHPGVHLLVYFTGPLVDPEFDGVIVL